jgi:hypothetical protein
MNSFTKYLKYRWKWLLGSIIAILIYFKLLDILKVEENAINFILFFIIIPIIVSLAILLIEKRIKKQRNNFK